MEFSLITAWTNFDLIQVTISSKYHPDFQKWLSFANLQNYNPQHAAAQK